MSKRKICLVKKYIISQIGIITINEQIFQWLNVSLRLLTAKQNIIWEPKKGRYKNQSVQPSIKNKENLIIFAS